jgi:hypothetical protein
MTMHLRKNMTFSVREARASIVRILVQSLFCLALALFLAHPVFAQYPGGTAGGANGATTGGYVPPQGGYSSGTGIGIAAGAAAGVGILYWAMHSRGVLTGCVQSGSDGLTLVDDKHNQAYSLEAGGADLKPGERLKLKGKKVKDSSGGMSFEVRSVAKDLGACTRKDALSTAPGDSKLAGPSQSGPKM